MTDANVRDAAQALLDASDRYRAALGFPGDHLAAEWDCLVNASDALRAALALAAPRDEKPAPKPDEGRACFRTRKASGVTVVHSEDCLPWKRICAFDEQPADAPAPAKGVEEALYEVFHNDGDGERGEHFVTTHDAVYAEVLRDSPHYIVVEYVPRAAVRAARGAR